MRKEILQRLLVMRSVHPEWDKQQLKDALLTNIDRKPSSDIERFGWEENDLIFEDGTETPNEGGAPMTDTDGSD